MLSKYNFAYSGSAECSHLSSVYAGDQSSTPWNRQSKSQSLTGLLLLLQMKSQAVQNCERLSHCAGICKGMSEDENKDKR